MQNIDIENIIKNCDFILNETSTRSNKKLYPLHSGLANLLLTNNNEIKCYGLGLPEDNKNSFEQLNINGNIINFPKGKEQNIKGFFNNKKTDLTFKNIKTQENIANIFIKTMMRNYRQNKDNYFCSINGETINLRRNNYKVGHIICLLTKIPYYDKKGNIIRYDILSLEDIERYVILFNSPTSNIERPDALCLLPFNKTNNIFTLQNLSLYFNKQDKNLDNLCDLSYFWKELTNYDI